MDENKKDPWKDNQLLKISNNFSQITFSSLIKPDFYNLNPTLWHVNCVQDIVLNQTEIACSKPI